MEKINVTPPAPQQPQPPSSTTQTGGSVQFAQTLRKTSSGDSMKYIFVGLVLLMMVLGAGTGYLAASMTTPQQGGVAPTETVAGSEETTALEETVKVGQVIGAKEASDFKDSAEGIIVAGGLDGEGSHHLVRSGGKSQNVYLTSSVMDLKLLEGHKVKVSGETFKAQKAGWLMDVGRVEVLELNAQLPEDAQPVEQLMDE